MPFIPSEGRSLLIINVTEDEYNEIAKLIETQFQLMDYPILFPSREGKEYATMLLAAGMGCGNTRWDTEYLPEIISRFNGRIVYMVEPEGEAK